eukprot:scaffold25972_cov32-Tisochrysis_lutea.AAC.9
MLRPADKQRKAAHTPRSMSNALNGRPRTNRTATRAESICSMLDIDHGVWSMMESSATRKYWAKDAASSRSWLNIPRFPISTRPPPSQRSASEHTMKSVERLFMMR